MSNSKNKRKSESSSSSSDSDSSVSSNDRKKKKSGSHSENSSEDSSKKKTQIEDLKKTRKTNNGDKNERRKERGKSSEKNDHGRSRKRSHEDNEKEAEIRKRQKDREDRHRNEDERHRRYGGDDKYRRDERDENRRDGRREDYRNDRQRRDERDRRDQPRRDRRDFRNGRRNRSRSFDHTNAKWGKSDETRTKDEKPTGDRQKPNFGLSGKLTEETNTYRGVVIKYSEPPEARKPKRRWRLYPFKGEKALQTLYIHRESAYLIGRDRKVVDLPVDHPSCSKQHAALQYRLVPFTRDDGSAGKRVRPYIIDLESANGTFINNKRIDAKKYVELLERDVIKFGFSSREYVLLHENSKDEAQDDDVKVEEEEVEVKKENKT